MKIILDTSDGIRAGYTRVSTILRPVSKYKGVKKAILDEAAGRGTEVHKAIQADAQGLVYPLAKDAQGFFKSFQKWQSVSDYQIERCEERLYDDELRITGCLDAIVSHNGVLHLVDWKNTSSQQRDYWELQGTFYHYLAWKNGIRLHDRIMFVQLCREGAAPKVFSFERSDVLWRQCLKYYYISCGQDTLV